MYPLSHRFEVDLYHESDFVLHLNPRYDEGSGYVVHNTYQNNVWGKEETKSQTPFPRGQLFALQILVTLSSYKVTDAAFLSGNNYRLTLVINGLSIKNSFWDFSR